MVFSTVHSDRTLVVLLCKQFRSWHSTSCNSVSIIMYCTRLLWVNLTLGHTSAIHSPFSCQLIMSNFSSKLIVFYQFFTLIALGDVDLRFSLTLVRKPML